MTKNQRKWIEALRSGKYLQGTGFLRRKAAGSKLAYCCLGVACDVHRASDGMKWEESRPQSTKGDIVFSYDMNTALPSVTVLEFMGITNSQAIALADLNDSGSTFEDIARELEDNYFTEAGS